MKNAFGFLMLGLFFTIALLAASGNRASASNLLADAPSEDEIKATIKAKFDEVYFNNSAKTIWNVESVEYEFGPIKVGSTAKKQMGRGEEAREVYPVKVKVTIKQTRKDGEVRTTERGVEGEIFFFFKDGFDEWDFRTGR